ncbi:MAG: MAPEG family protein [Allosphingosinicella sp.]
MAFTRTQAGVAAGMAGGFALTVAAFAWPHLPAVPDDTEGRLALWLDCSLLACLWLVVSVALLARHRFFTPEDIDGGGLSNGTPKAKLLQSLIQNTLEQALLAVVAYGAWLWLGPENRRGLVVVCALYFAVGRLLFFAGYSRGAPWRALGFTLTFYPTVGLYLLLLPAIVRQVIGSLA